MIITTWWFCNSYGVWTLYTWFFLTVRCIRRHPSQRRQPSSARLYHVVANSAASDGAHPSTDASTPLTNGGVKANGHTPANGHSGSEACSRANGQMDDASLESGGPFSRANCQMNGSRNASMAAGTTRGFAEELIYEKLPQDIADRHVLLMDPILGAGTSAVRAIEVRHPFPSGSLSCPPACRQL